MSRVLYLLSPLILVLGLSACGGQGAGIPYDGYIDPYFPQGYYGNPSKNYKGPNYYMDSEGRLYHPYGYDYPFAPYYFKPPELPPAQSEIEEESGKEGGGIPEKSENKEKKGN